MEAAGGRYLPEQLWWDILARLPLHSLCTTMAVSKPMRHLAKAAFTQRPRLGFQGETHGFGAVPYFYIFSEDGRKMFHSGLYETDSKLMISLRVCNGFLLMSTAVGYAIVNPLNRRSYTLPPLPDNNDINRKIGLIENTMLAFDPRQSPHYKVVAFWFQLVPGRRKYLYTDDVAIFSSKTRDWDFSKLNFHRGNSAGSQYYLSVSDDQSVCIGEFVYRLNKTLITFNNTMKKELKLLVFKGEEEKFELLNLPKSLSENERRYLADVTTVRTIGESVSTLQFIYYNFEAKILVWSLERGDGSDHGSYNWILRRKFCLTTLWVISGFAPHPSLDAIFLNFKKANKRSMGVYLYTEDAHDTVFLRYEDGETKSVLQRSCRAVPFLFCLNDPDLDRESILSIKY